MLARDLARVARGAATALRAAVRPRAAAGLAVLDGPSVVRPPRAAVYRLRLHNPGGADATLAVAIRGERTDAPAHGFVLRTTRTLAAGAAAECWIVTDWHGIATVAEVAPAAEPHWPRGEPIGRWTIEAHVEGRAAGDALRIAGTVAA